MSALLLSLLDCFPSAKLTRTHLAINILVLLAVLYCVIQVYRAFHKELQTTKLPQKMDYMCKMFKDLALEYRKIIKLTIATSSRIP